jgi:hypothetical protein
MIQLDFFSILDDATKTVVAKSKHSIGRDVSIGPVSGTKLEILQELPSRKMGASRQAERYVLARCECGIEKEIQLKHLRNRTTKTCGNRGCRDKIEHIYPEIGQRFGSKVVVEVYKSDTYLDSIAICKCDCGSVKRYRMRSLQTFTERCRSCSAYNSKIQFQYGDNVKGSVFIRECLGTYTPTGDFSRRVLLKCFCGKEFAYKTHEINSTNKISCGCGRAGDKANRTKAGFRFPGTMLTSTGNTKNERKKPLVEVKCDCGRTRFVNYNRILRGKTKSCGCLYFQDKSFPSSQFVSQPKSLKASVLKLAKGKCECCQSPAPFLTPLGKPYLEVHHVIPVSSGGWNGKDNLVAICPNCHREIHHGKHGDILSESLYDKVLRLSRCKSKEEKTNHADLFSNM